MSQKAVFLASVASETTRCVKCDKYSATGYIEGGKLDYFFKQQTQHEKIAEEIHRLQMLERCRRRAAVKPYTLHRDSLLEIQLVRVSHLLTQIVLCIKNKKWMMYTIASHCRQQYNSFSCCCNSFCLSIFVMRALMLHRQLNLPYHDVSQCRHAIFVSNVLTQPIRRNQFALHVLCLGAISPTVRFYS